MEMSGSLLAKTVQLTCSLRSLQRGGRGASGPDGAGATQFHGVFCADVSVVTHASVQLGH